MRIYNVGDTVLLSELIDNAEVFALVDNGCVCVKDGTTQVFYDYEILCEDILLNTKVLIVGRRVYRL